MVILLLALPPNATHMYQPLDVAVFKPFKAMVGDELESKLLSTADVQLSKKDAIQIACSAYETAIMDRPSNAVSGFRSTGLFPPSLINMTKRLRVYTNGGARGEIEKEAWLKRQRETVRLEARSEILTLPPAAETLESTYALVH
ncbi:hypothetical protein PF005_g7834 [Phytophthora fragariae]|uniref:DDE-1 domain-containing protein n=1 Tax=Phytophthora fragariae TaxID=53985 RepID=A0A6A3YIV3_9STRA|nr:hypothetical protein PF011_g6864 [Phytophthora fragariae]KAE9219543.1 hypothetical protein PF005_g7834 [Phytophthora fragariae]KAE9251374.1 hypothetical protein PF002_g4332 [Phytophthora fragariae]